MAPISTSKKQLVTTEEASWNASPSMHQCRRRSLPRAIDISSCFSFAIYQPRMDSSNKSQYISPIVCSFLLGGMTATLPFPQTWRPWPSSPWSASAWMISFLPSLNWLQSSALENASTFQKRNNYLHLKSQRSNLNFKRRCQDVGVYGLWYPVANDFKPIKFWAPFYPQVVPVDNGWRNHTIQFCLSCISDICAQKQELVPLYDTFMWINTEINNRSFGFSFQNVSVARRETNFLNWNFYLPIDKQWRGAMFPSNIKYSSVHANPPV